MRRIMVVIAVAAGLYMGCEQSQPIGSGEESFSLATKVSPKAQEFLFENIVANRDDPKTQYNARGRVEYSIALSPILQRDMVKVTIALAGQLDNPQTDNPPIPFEGSLTETIALDNNGVATLEKGYLVTEIGMRLVIRYDMTAERLEVKEMWLQAAL